jgi:tetratricopeptide (TPR) repeat protein
MALAREFLPPSYGGQVLLTTRAQVMGRFAQRVEVDTMSQEVGVLFLLRRAGLLASDARLEQPLSQERAPAGELMQELGGLPLALDQAGAYIEETQCSIEEYLHLYRTRRALLLSRRGGILNDHPAPVATTWNLSFQRVAVENPAAAELLRLCAFLSPDAIPEEILLQSADELGPVLALVVKDAYLLGQAMEALRAYSLIERDPQTKTLAVHRLVQAVLRDTLSVECKQQWMQRVVAAVNGAFPAVEFEAWAMCERYLPHAFLCATWIEQGQFTMPEAAHLLHQVGSYLAARGRYMEAETFLQRALEINEQQLGVDHPDTTACVNNLASLYVNQGKYTKAETLYQRALAIQEQQLGVDHPDTATYVNNLARLYVGQGRYVEAEPLYQRALAIWERHLGTDHSNTATCLNSLAVLYVRQGRYAEAEPLHQRSLEINERLLGTDHPGTALCLNSLGYLYLMQRKYAEAEPLLQRALAIQERQLGANHPNTINVLNNLGSLYLDLGKYTEAEAILRRALAISEQQLGTDHPDTVASANNLASLYMKREQYEEAEPLLRRALASNEQQLGANHPNTANALNNLAYLYVRQGKYAEAEPLYQRSLAISKRQLGADHPDTVASIFNLAILYVKWEKYEEAEPLFQRALVISEQALGPEHPETAATTLETYASLLRTMHRTSEAMLLEQRARAIRAKQQPC